MMTEPKPGAQTQPLLSQRLLPALLLLFVGSGCAALIYEIVWLQMLQLVIGSSAVSLAVLLGTFMGGMCLGSVGLARFVSARRHPLRIYALLEVGIGCCGIVLLFVLPLVARLYAANAGHGFTAILLRGAVCAVCLLPPTLLMGATLPAISRWVETTPQGVSWLGFFYGGNLAGAVFGCLLAGFYLLRVHDMATATCVAGVLNVAVAAAGFGLALLTPKGAVTASTRGNPVERAAGSDWVYVVIALSGMSALGAEVIWTRLLSLVFGGTTYTFSIILAGFLVGLGVGSSVGSFLARGRMNPRMALGWCQVLLMGGIAWTTVMLAKSIPYWPIDPSISTSPWFNFQIDLARCLWAILPATFLWGASFPLALAAVAVRGQDPAKLVGGVYAANTVGAIIGAIGSSLILIAWIGTQQAQRVLIGIAALAAVVTFVSFFKESRIKASAGSIAETFGLRTGGAISLLACLALMVGLVWSVPKTPWGLIAHGRYLATKGEQDSLLYVGEGMNASVAVTESAGSVRNFHVSGKIEASSDPRDMRLQRMLAHIPGLLHANPKSVLIVGCGAGVTAGSFTAYPGIEKIVICEIEPLIPRVVATYFSNENYNVVKDPRVTIVYDDARNFVLTTKDKFDIITSDPIHPWVKGAATLYTKEYFEMCKAHLNPGGFVTQWVPLYESNVGVVKSEIATFFDVFPHGTIWSNDDDGKGYDTVMLGQSDALALKVDELQERLDRPDYSKVAQSLKDVQFKSAVDLLATYAGQAADLAPWLKKAEINRDRNLRLQYLAGMAPNLYNEATIYDAMVAYRRFPERLFSASDESLQTLRDAIDKSKTDK